MKPRDVHLGDEEIQSLSDGTLRGPEGMAARSHCDLCALCAAEVALFDSLCGRLSSLRDPPVPPDFTALVLHAAAARETALAQRRQTVLAALPAAAVGLCAVVGWALSAGPLARLAGFVDAWSFCRHLFRMASPVLDATRLPLGVGALSLSVIFAALLTRALRGPRQTATPAES